MLKKINIRLIITIIMSVADEAIISIIVIIVLSKIGVDIPLWSIVTVALIFLAINAIEYRAMRRKPQLGFENMIGRRGVAVKPIAHTGTVRIGNEIWWAMTRDGPIEAGAEILVIEQTGLKLIVARPNS